MARLRAVALSALLCALSACTAFEGLEPDDPATGGGGAGGDGGGGSPSGPRSLLPELDAAHLCSLVFRCPELAGSLLLSTGLPLAVVDGQGVPVALNYSACVDWLTLPLEPAHEGFGAARAVLSCVAASTTCTAALGCTSVELLADGDPRCAGAPAPRCDGTDVIDCPRGVAVHCGGRSFAPGSTCELGSDAAPACAVGQCGAPELSCDADGDEAYVFVCGDTGLRAGVDCAAYGLACDPAQGCVGATGPTPCATLGAQSCSSDGRFARACALGSASTWLAAEIACEALDRECLEEGGAARCATTGGTCSPFEASQNVCLDRSTVQVCLDGHPETIDCSAIGRSCVDGSPDGEKTAHCG